MKTTKIYGRDLGLSVCFRQWPSIPMHQLLHGTPLSIGLVFETIDNSEVDITASPHIGELQEGFTSTFCRKLLVAEDDPAIMLFEGLEKAGLADLVIVPATGMTAFAKLSYEITEDWLRDVAKASLEVRLVQVEVRGHGGDRAVYARAAT